MQVGVLAAVQERVKVACRRVLSLSIRRNVTIGTPNRIHTLQVLYILDFGPPHLCCCGDEFILEPLGVVRAAGDMDGALVAMDLLVVLAMVRLELDRRGFNNCFRQCLQEGREVERLTFFK
jgi:hypothetical protein